MLKCTKCKKTKPVTEFYKRSSTPKGYKSHCKACELAYHQTEQAVESHKKSCLKYLKTDKGKISNRVRSARFRKTSTYKESIRKSRAKYPERRQAQITLWNAVQSGKVVRPDSCSICNTLCIPNGHHPDYTKPLMVIWLCKDCHEAVHHPIPS
jgi:hypothetical protein